MRRQNAPYGEYERARRLPEPAKRAHLAGAAPHHRSEFERDRARVLHSSGSRHMVHGNCLRDWVTNFLLFVQPERFPE